MNATLQKPTTHLVGVRGFRLVLVILATLASLLVVPALEAKEASAAESLGLPYPHNVRWHNVRGITSGHNGYDIQPRNWNERSRASVVAVGSGTAKLLCADRNGMAIVSLSVSGHGTFRYVHLDGTDALSRYGRVGGSKTIGKGHLVGKLFPTGGSGCGGQTSSGPHLHLTPPRSHLRYGGHSLDGRRYIELLPVGAPTPGSSSTPASKLIDDPRVIDRHGNFNWYANTTSGHNSHWGDSKFTYAAPGSLDSSAHWHFGNRKGVYRVQVYVPHRNGSANTLYEILQNGKIIKTFRINQYYAYGWKNGPEIRLSGKTEIRVKDSGATPRYSKIAVDAIQLKGVRA